MAENPEFGRRLRDAKRAWEQRHDRRLTWREIGERMGQTLRREPYDPSVVRRWFMAGTEPETFAVTKAIAEAIEADAGWLAFGADDPPAQDRGKSDPEPVADITTAMMIPPPAKDAGTSSARARSAGAGRPPRPRGPRR